MQWYLPWALKDGKILTGKEQERKVIFLMEKMKANAKRWEGLSMQSIHLYSPLHKTIPTLMRRKQKLEVKSRNSLGSSKLVKSWETHSGSKQPQVEFLSSPRTDQDNIWIAKPYWLSRAIYFVNQ